MEITDKTKIKLITILPQEHQQCLDLLSEDSVGSEGSGPFVIINDNTWNNFTTGDVIKTEYGTYWGIVETRLCFRWTENPEFDRCIWETKEKMRIEKAKTERREYMILYLEKLSNSDIIKLIGESGQNVDPC